MTNFSLESAFFKEHEEIILNLLETLSSLEEVVTVRVSEKR
jgi:hypothetical protein